MNLKGLFLRLFLCTVVLISCASAAEFATTGLGVGAPKFNLKDVTGRRVNSNDLKGKNVVIVFYVNHS